MERKDRKLGPPIEKSLQKFTPLYEAVLNVAKSMGYSGKTLRVRDVAAECEVTHATLYAWLNTGKMPKFATETAVRVLTTKGQRSKEALIAGIPPEVMEGLRMKLKSAKKGVSERAIGGLRNRGEAGK